MFREFQALEVLNLAFISQVKEAKQHLYHELSEEDYEKARQEFLAADNDLAIQQEQLLVYFLYSYFCGAVYDEDAFSKIKLVMVHTMLITELFLARWIMNRYTLSLEEKVDIAHRYAREIEHSDPNLNAVENFMRERTCFEFSNLLMSILN